MKRTAHLLLAACLMFAVMLSAGSALAANAAVTPATTPVTTAPVATQAAPSQKVGQPGPSQKTGQTINLNTADANQLTQVRGIGKVTAAAIIEKRNALGGRFTSVDQLLQVKGIGQKKLEKIKPQVSL
ncbi:MAG: helix-hairpin-helix domain-containing protein [Desulfobulbaceae bacterium]|jgi:competence protein ComEA|nr:helix-hairpin-helix domain-containing protein [Desulfobulbaceae bacterium]